MASVRNVNGSPDEVWDDLEWADMNEAEQALWAVLGWDEDSWQEETDPPESDELYWADLSSAQQKAAGELGYTQELWDEE